MEIHHMRFQAVLPGAPRETGVDCMNILIIDAQGGGIGRALVSGVRQALPDAVVTAVGANSAAATAMLKAGAHHAATGENPVIVGCRTADVIAGPIGIVIADALFGEITPAMAAAVGQSRAKRVLIPASHCGTVVAGTENKPVGWLVQEAVREIAEIGKTLL